MQFWRANIAYCTLFLEKLLSIRLQLTRRDDYYLTEEKYEHIKKCAETAYPNDDFYIYKECSTVEEFLKNGCCANPPQVYAVVGKNWYFIAIQRIGYVGGYDFASASGNCYDILSVISTITKLFNGKKCRLLCRETTSYPLVKRFEKAGRCRIIQDNVIIRNNERNHLVTLVLSRRTKKKSVSPNDD